MLAGPLVLETFFKHFLSAKTVSAKSKAREDLIYDEGEVIISTCSSAEPEDVLMRSSVCAQPSC